MRTKLVVGTLVATAVVLAAACGGESTRKSDDGDGGTTQGGASSGGSAGVAVGGATAGGSTSTGGMAGGDCSTLPPFGYTGPCVTSCADRPEQSVAPECAGDHYVCPEGTRPARDCPSDSCARRDDFECCRTNGTVEPMRCSADGGATLPCVPGSVQHERGASCIPDGVDAVGQCIELDGRTCADRALECHQGKGCGDTRCTCQIVPDAGWHWTCATVLCVE